MYLPPPMTDPSSSSRPMMPPSSSVVFRPLKCWWPIELCPPLACHRTPDGGLGVSTCHVPAVVPGGSRRPVGRVHPEVPRGGGSGQVDAAEQGDQPLGQHRQRQAAGGAERQGESLG